MRVKFNKEKYIADPLAKFYQRVGIGRALADPLIDLVIFGGGGGLVADMLNRTLGWNIPVDKVIYLGVFVIILLYVIGFLNEKIGFLKYMNRRSSKVLNPYWEEKFAEVNEKLDEIIKKQ